MLHEKILRVRTKVLVFLHVVLGKADVFQDIFIQASYYSALTEAMKAVGCLFQVRCRKIVVSDSALQPTLPSHSCFVIPLVRF